MKLNTKMILLALLAGSVASSSLDAAGKRGRGYDSSNDEGDTYATHPYGDDYNSEDDYSHSEDEEGSRQEQKRRNPAGTESSPAHHESAPESASDTHAATATEAGPAGAGTGARTSADDESLTGAAACAASAPTPPTLRIKTPPIGAFDLGQAVYHGHEHWVASCIERGADVNELIKNAISPLPGSMKKFYMTQTTQLHVAIDRCNYNMVTLLCQKYHADPTIKDDKGRTALVATIEKLGEVPSFSSLSEIDNCYSIIQFLTNAFPELIDMGKSDFETPRQLANNLMLHDIVDLLNSASAGNQKRIVEEDLSLSGAGCVIS